MSSRRQSDYKRARCHDLRAEGLSIREIAEAVGLSKSAVGRILQEPRPDVDENLLPPPPPEGNERAKKSGAHSERHVQPLRVRFIEDIRKKWPHLAEDDPRIATLADRMARTALVSAWLDQREEAVRRDGDAFGSMVQVEKWATRIEVLTAELNAEAAAAPSTSSKNERMDLSRLTVSELNQLRYLLAVADGAPRDGVTFFGSPIPSDPTNRSHYARKLWTSLFPGHEFPELPAGQDPQGPFASDGK